MGKYFRTGAKSAPKSQEKVLVKKAKALYEDPTLLIPECDENCRICPFNRERKALQKVHRYRKNEKALNKFASKGPHLARAYAATIILAHTESAPFLAMFPVGGSKVSYAKRGATKPEYLIGVQHYDDPTLRLLSISETVNKFKVHVYSLKERMICTGRVPGVPTELVDELMRKFKFLSKVKGGYACPHTAKEPPLGEPYIVMEIGSADVEISACIQCAGRSNLFTPFSRRMAVPDTDDFLIAAEYPVDDDSCIEGLDSLPPKIAEAYKLGEIDTRELLNRFIKKVKMRVHRDGPGRGGILINNGACFKGDPKGFIDSLEPSAEERTALEVIFTERVSYLAEDDTSGSIVAEHWEEHGEEMLTALCGDPELAKKRCAEVDPSHGVFDVLRDMARVKGERESLDKLPKYKKLPDLAAFGDTLAREYLIGGKESTRRRTGELLQLSGADVPGAGVGTRKRSMAYAFLIQIGMETGEKWRYTKEEIESGEYLAQYVEKLLGADGDEYHEALQVLTAHAGGETDFTPE